MPWPFLFGAAPLCISSSASHGFGEAVLDNVGRHSHAMGGQFGDVYETFEPWLKLDKCAEVGHARHLAVDDGILRIAIGRTGPWIATGLLDAEGHSLLYRIEVDHDDF